MIVSGINHACHVVDGVGGANAQVQSIRNICDFILSALRSGQSGSLRLRIYELIISLTDFGFPFEAEARAEI